LLHVEQKYPLNSFVFVHKNLDKIFSGKVHKNLDKIFI
jgi:hypothetical protein